MDKTSESRRVLCRYRYDALDRVAVVDPGAQGAVLRFYQKSRLTVEIQGAVRRRVFHGADRLLAEYETEGSSIRADLLGTDTQNSVLQAVGSQGQQSLAYSPYGHSAQGGPFSGFNGERADPVTGHYLLGNGYRAFNPVLMRFNSPDSLSPFGRAGLNAYVYCQGDPVNRSDPSGHAGLLGLPDLALRSILKNLTSKDLVNLSLTSKAMGRRVSGAVDRLPVDVTDPNALFAIHNVLKSKMGISPGVLKNDAFKAKFERAAANIKQGISKEIQSVDRRTQSILDYMARVTGASELQAKRALERAQRFQAAAPEKLAQITRQMAEYRQLRNDWGALINREADTGRRIAEIRTALNSP
ncbi:RHS repeat-associated core domain-containing protein [Pseudomonas savastanoi pv. phaseolicola]|uniref:YD repeat protein n=3 Tax=Pseudomonas savastanoi TaxID=29438 RepID=A0A3M3FXR6_PSESG|nr:MULTISPECIES: RHS repeat-associated core domain-containing protein [Pseudomonas]AAZ34779.1 YD repeat protein [Pseudomonas savastanoi pv. phaseolicola 1448A]KPB35186.1 YD repeat protein [Pseudomonas savastanoi pv. phaseolicola]KPB35884.1 YD repeat protein [Pseudomonas savastanoi pv. phaseolicola]KPB39613.1 YD repeat protein [Pseudomonas savastanoi pv. phaseolicola]KPB51861.1 YD repeat protein [Pseudomonas savastanoi pv. phaseolicola]